jgi:hypothetical protein
MVSTESFKKLAMIVDTIKTLPQDRLKTIVIDWKVLESRETEDSMWCPTLMVELYEEKRPEGVEVEICDSTGEYSNE